MTRTPLSDTVTAERIGRVLVIRIDNPPLNLLSASVRQGMARGLAEAVAAPGVAAIVMVCAGKTGWSGADIREFGGPIARPDLPELVADIAASPKPVIAALHGRVLGGGFEIALAATARIAAPGTRLGLPEIRLGLVPGCGGIEAVTRLAGTEAALDICLSGREVPAEEALRLGLIDAVAAGEMTEAAIRLAGAPPTRPPARPDPDAPARIAGWAATTGARLRGQAAPAEALALIEAAALDPAAPLDGQSRAAFDRLERGPQSAALRHLFAAERKLRDLPALPEGAADLPIEIVGIVGAGTMGSGIATAMLAAGLTVLLHDADAQRLARGRDLIAGNLDGAVRRGKISLAGRDAALARLQLAPALAALSAADLLIEAVYESMAVKKAVFSQLDAIARPGAILATNTSFLNIDDIAAATRRPAHVLGTHFFSPAHVMKLLEVVRAAETAPAVIRAVMLLGQRIGKVAVCVGNCPGFVGNRILLRRQQAAMGLLLQGASPYDIDRAMEAFGLPMGPFRMADLAGLDVGWDRDTSAGRSVEEVFCEAGRFGRKNGLGYYDYDASGRASSSEGALALIAGFRAKAGHDAEASAAQLGPEALLQRLLDPMLEETGKIIAEGIVQRPSDIDVIWVHGYGWPAWRGGPSWYRDHRG
ncbi:3-hydroxyacyl-CoA dehydrogenase NAD-binding domain-containing protein [Frigidibacter mobilis]|uniref:3-hydroxyacyl-CoA dehydrogenase / short chain enoyl-CoA hydratase n=1 Tax=Frigidibacter mobilis TaxID=1335048 RepID=A0A159Z704_9RHOB|nr:3-hydroxyacyl-CoA dehydrogenase NAD-binding domain-containing protein [Frigidibacter mobilis]AMY70328.1 3-hydroxyacyl-CoA dehydrogenase / short chain enoyl-CoA hydratase [Frigidibacter mobilis]